MAVGEHAGSSWDSDDLNDLDQRHVFAPFADARLEVGRKAIADDGPQEDFTVLVGGLTGGIAAARRAGA